MTDDVDWFQDFFAEFLFQSPAPAIDARFRELGPSAVGMVIRGSVWTLRRLHEAERAGLVSEPEMAGIAAQAYDRATDLILEAMARGVNEIVVGMLIAAAMADSDAGVRAIAALTGGMKEVDAPSVRAGLKKCANDRDRVVSIAANLALSSLSVPEHERLVSRQVVESFVRQESPTAFERSKNAVALMAEMAPTEATPDVLEGVLFGMRFADAVKLLLIKIALGTAGANG